MKTTQRTFLDYLGAPQTRFIIPVYQRVYTWSDKQCATLWRDCAHVAVYNYLLRCEDRRTYQCHPSYRTIGRAVQLSENTVRKYVAGLEEKGLIRTEPSTVTTKDGRMRNGSLIYTIRPIQEALELNYQRQFLQAERDMERAKAEKRLAELNQQNKKEERA